MTTVSAATAEPETLADLIRSLGDVDPQRIFLKPQPGTATEADLYACGLKRVELIDGTLVRKTMGGRESFVAATLFSFLWVWKQRTNPGLVGVPDANFRLTQGLVRLPDLSFTAWVSLPDDFAHLQPVLDFPPDLAVEILSESDRAGEVRRKIGEYFAYGTKLVWVVDPRACNVAVYADAETSTPLTRDDTLDGGAVLPGFALPLAQLFDEPQLNPRPRSGA